MLPVKKCAVLPTSLLNKCNSFLRACGSNDRWEFYSKYKSKYDYRTSEAKALLLSASDNRCAICSRMIYDANQLEEKNSVNVFTIEHMVPKEQDPALIFEWSNMLPCCVACNSARGHKKHCPDLYINPCEREDLIDLFGFLYNGEVFCANKEFDKQVEYMVRLYNLNDDSRGNLLKSKRRWYYKLLIDKNYQEMVELNREFGLSDNIIIFKDMYLFNERYK